MDTYDTPDSSDALGDAMAQLARSYAGPTPLEDTLRAVTSAAVELIPGVDCAAILLLGGGADRTAAPTGPVAAALDELQHRLGEGPCLDAAANRSVIYAPDLETDPRWPLFTAGALALGVRGVMSFRLYTVRDQLGALNLFSFAANTIDPDAETVGAMLATHAATALIAEHREGHFQSALASRDVIGQAKGIIMERFGVDAVRAFELLTKLSQETNTPVAVLAQRLTTQRKGPARG